MAIWNSLPVINEYATKPAITQTATDKTILRTALPKTAIRPAGVGANLGMSIAGKESMELKGKPTGKMRGMSGGIVPGISGGIYPARRAWTDQRCHGDRFAMIYASRRHNKSRSYAVIVLVPQIEIASNPEPQGIAEMQFPTCQRSSFFEREAKSMPQDLP